METLKNFLWPIVAIGGIGAFIDFLIGRTGQERAKDFLLRWWVRFDDVHWRNFGKEEGLFAGELIEKWFGRRIWSLRRYVVACLLLSLSLVIGYIRLSISTKDGIWCYFCLYAAGYEYGVYYGLSTFILVLMGFSLSVSFTRFLTFRMAYFCGAGGWKNLMMFCLMMLLNYIIFLVLGVTFTTAIRITFLSSIFSAYPGVHFPKNSSIGNYLDGFFILMAFGISFTGPLAWAFVDIHPLDLFALYSLSYFSSVVRFFLSVVFIGSFLLRPLLMRPISLVWARIVESEKPVFTVIFGGVAAFASAISEVAKHL